MSRRLLLRELPPLRQSGIRYTSGPAIRVPSMFGTGYVRLVDVTGNRVSTPDHASFAIANELDVRALLFRDDWADGALRRIVGQRAGASDRAWSFYTDSVGELGFNWSSDGTGGTGGFEESSVNLGTQPDQSWLWVRTTFRSSAALGFYEIHFYTSSDPITTHPEAVVWTQLGVTRTQAIVTSIFDSTADVIIGAIDDGGHTPGRVGYVEIRNGINGAIVANPDFRYRSDFTTPSSLTDGTGKIWTINSPSHWVLPLVNAEAVFTPPPHYNFHSHRPRVLTIRY